MNVSTVSNNQSYASISGDIVNNNRYSSAEHGIGNNAQDFPSKEGCIKADASIAITTASFPAYDHSRTARIFLKAGSSTQ